MQNVFLRHLRNERKKKGKNDKVATKVVNEVWGKSDNH